jgi:lipid II:glycine glycyltransferase (peptidoglycan interpeptide bridge formation enzyme)
MKKNYFPVSTEKPVMILEKRLDSGLKIEEVHNPDDSLISLFWKLLDRLGKNKEFNTPDEQKFKHELRILFDNKLAGLFVAKFRNEVVNLSIASKIGIASYMYGAINPDYKKFTDCPAPGHLAQWEMIRALKRMGLKTYDMGFCPGPVPVDDHLCI